LKENQHPHPACLLPKFIVAPRFENAAYVPVSSLRIRAKMRRDFIGFIIFLAPKTYLLALGV